MDSLEFTERPELRRTIMLTAFAGWPDASEAATRAIRYLADQISAKKFASIDPEDFYNFVEQRPKVRNGANGERILSWPENQFYAWRNTDGEGPDLVLFRGVEPHFKWRSYSAMIYEVAEACNVEMVITLGALLDAVPHTRPVKVTRSSQSDSLGPGLEHLKFRPSSYQGPTGIMSIVLDRMTAAGIPCASYWGHSPHYVQAKPNPNVTKALLEAVTEIIPVEVDTERLQRRGGDFTRRLTKALADQDEVTKYVSELEERWDKANSPSDDESSGEAAAPLIAELEAFLRSEAGSQSDEMSDDESDDQDQDEGNPPSV
ncbi:MAG: PAC2 family protein [Chloroflexi bacterium]|jgi:proteasome assembly chaperone (PAC2) family protein|nr:PAC2 family protein [Chloroflexota bacterium]MBT4072504.1 PAC2 family protein [Chloroflexota bacterium]MBT4514785.1 PAC2 family protein [Chloroflexota bacterium]MBT6680429.1 PAC2 family protein [Chloroflexota bacterium]